MFGLGIHCFYFIVEIQNGVNPVLLWCSHWVWDVCINTIMLSIFLAIALRGEGKGSLREYAIWGGFVAFMPYVVLQYIVIIFYLFDRKLR